MMMKTILSRQEFDEYFNDFYSAYPITEDYKNTMWIAYSYTPMLNYLDKMIIEFLCESV